MAIEERLPEPANPLGVDGIEFVEYATARPQEFGALLERLGFAAAARHRSREVVQPEHGAGEPQGPRFRRAHRQSFWQHLAAHENHDEQSSNRQRDRAAAPHGDAKPDRNNGRIGDGIPKDNGREEFRGLL